jgi:4-hydroxy-tetrahydrodipicolinate reductase
VAVARATTTLAAGELPAGTIAAQRTRLAGFANGAERVRFTANWYCTDEIDPQWDLRPTGWRVRVQSDAPLDVALPFPIPLDELGAATPAYTANRPVNAIPYVCQAAPGILTAADLPPITPAGPQGPAIARAALAR